MKFNWHEIKDIIKLNCNNAFSDCQLSISDQDLEEGLLVFKNLLIHPMNGCDKLRGLETDLCEAIYKCCTTGINDIHYLKTVCTNLEAFYKKILIIIGSNSYTNLMDKRWTLWPLTLSLNLCPNFVASGLGYANVNLDDYKHDSEACYILFYAYRCRNDVHNASKLDLAQWSTCLKYCLATYIWVTIKYKNQLITTVPNLNKDEFRINDIDLGNRYIYDFLGFGKTTNELKNQIINSFILDKIFNKEPIKVSEIIDEVQAFSKNSLDADSIKRFLWQLSNLKRLKYSNIGKTEVELIPSERERLKKQSNQYITEVQEFRIKLKKEIDVYNINYDVNDIISLFSEFLDYNFDKEIRIGEGDGDYNQYSNYSYLIKSLTNIGFSNEQAKEIFKKVIILCKHNGILYKLSMGRVFGKLSNSISFNNYYKQNDREVYLDTQIVLYILCLHDDLPKPSSGLLLVAKQLTELYRKNTQIRLYFPTIYLKEVITHFRRALILIPFTKHKNIDGLPISNNVFYQNYCNLKGYADLPERVNTFEDFMYYFYSIKYDDLYDPDFYKIITGIIESILNENGIVLFKNIPHYKEDDLKPTINIFQTVIIDNMLEKKDNYRLKSDSIMGHYLFETNFAIEPFFITLDRSFRPFKDGYMNKFRRKATSFYWHLLTPSQFLNHIDLLNLTIDENRLSNELLSLIESEGFDFKTHTAIDNICRFMDVPNLAAEQREKNLKTLFKELIGSGEYNREIEIFISDGNLELKNFSKLSNDVMTYYLEKGGKDLQDYNNIFADNKKFEVFVSILKSYSNNISNIDFEKIDSEIRTLF